MHISKIAAAIITATALYTVSPAQASDTSSSIRGQVIDATGNTLANVSVVVVHQPTGYKKTLTTTDGGVFQAKGLPVGGPYIVSIAGGTELKFENVNDLFLKLGEASKISLVAQSATASPEIERITVTGQLAMAGTYSKGPSKEFSDEDILNTAAISRDLKSILKSDSRMVVDTTADGGPALSIGGGNVRGNSLTVDGVKQNDDFGLNKNGYPGRRSPIALDAIEQLAVNIAPFEVTYGDFQGGNLNIVTKSGTNEFHGSAYVYRTDDGMAGEKSEGSDLNIGSFSEDTMGFTLGGPIIKDTLFFFASYEKFESTKPYQFTLDNENGTADPGEKAGVTQADFNQIAQIAQDVWNYDIGGYDTTSEENAENLLVKFDWFINDDHRASFTYQDNEGNTVRDFWGETFPNANWATSESNRYNMTESLTAYSLQVFSDWSADLSTELKIARKEVTTHQDSLGGDFGQMLITTDNGGQLYIGPDQFRHANALGNNRDMFKFKADYYLTDDHLITAGFEHEKLDIYNEFVFGSLGMTTFDSVFAFENNLGFHVFQNALTGNAKDALDEFEYTTDTFYLQDEWTVNDELTLRYGFRYTTYTNDIKPVSNHFFEERHGYSNQGNFDDLELFEPRVGFNYTYDDDTVIRGGFGLFGGGAPNVWLSNSYGNDGIRKAFTGCFGGCFDGVNQPAEIMDPANPISLPNGGFDGGNANTNSVHPSFEIPSSWKYNLGIERRQDLGMLGDNWNLTADVIFTQVKNAAVYRELNMGTASSAAKAPDGRPIYPITFPFDLSLENTDKGEGQVWTFTADKNFYTDFGNINFSMGYTYQDITEVNPGNAFVAFEGYSMPANDDFQSDKVYNSEFEVRHRFTANVTWSDELFGNNLTTVSLSMTSRDGRHFSHTMGTHTGNDFVPGAFGGFVGFASWDGYNSQSLYVPNGSSDPLVTYAEGFDQQGFQDYLASQSCLTAGTISRRHACTSEWMTRLDLHMMQEITISGDHKLEITFDVENIGNMLNDDWGRAESYTQPFNAPVVNVAIENGQYVYSNFSKPSPTVAKIPSVWKAQLGLRYRF